jgi:hypothetical protein
MRRPHEVTALFGTHNPNDKIMAFSLPPDDRSASHKTARQPRDTVFERYKIESLNEIDLSAETAS